MKVSTEFCICEDHIREDLYSDHWEEGDVVVCPKCGVKFTFMGYGTDPVHYYWTRFNFVTPSTSKIGKGSKK